MTPNELYKLEPESTSFDLSALSGCYYNHVPEVERIYFITNVKQTRVEIKTVKYWSFDGRRIWLLASVWFDQKPVMIIQNAGREGDDYVDRFVTDAALYSEMVKYLISLSYEDAETVLDVVNPDDEIESLTEFYGFELNGYFERW